MNIPTIANAEIVNRNCQSVTLSPPSPKKPIRDLAAMITNEVPTASFGSLLNNQSWNNQETLLRTH
jgi:hypothetical protein